MKFSIDGNEKVELLDWHISLIKNDIPEEIFTEDMQRRAKCCIDVPIHKFVHANKTIFVAALKGKGVLEVPGKIPDLAELIGNRDDMGLDSIDLEQGYSLECDEETIYSISLAYLKLAKTLSKKSEEDYLSDQLAWVFNEKIKGCLRRMKTEWIPKLSERNMDIPLDNASFVSMVTAQPDYLSRSRRIEANQ